MQNSRKIWSSTLFAAYFLSFQVAHSVERESLVWKVVGSIPGEVIVLSYCKVQPIVANIAAHNCWIYNLCDCKICNWKLKILQLMATATNSCKYCNQIATGQITQLIVANFATRIFAVYVVIFWISYIPVWNSKTFILQMDGLYQSHVCSICLSINVENMTKCLTKWFILLLSQQKNCC